MATKCPFCHREIPTPVDGMFEFHVGLHIRDLFFEKNPELAEMLAKAEAEFQYPVRIELKTDVTKILEQVSLVDEIEATCESS